MNLAIHGRGMQLRNDMALVARLLRSAKIWASIC
jgi:hypothetical protein